MECNNKEIVRKAYNNPKVVSEYERCFYSNDKLIGKGSHIERFLKTLSPNSRIIDLGCGLGQESEYIASKGFYVCGIDFSETMLNIAKSKNRNSTVEYILGDICDLQFLGLSEAFFSAAIYSFSLINLTYSQAEEALTSIFPLLDKKGKLFIVIQEDTENNSVGKEITVNESFDETEKQFYKFYSKTEFESLLNKCGYIVLSLNSIKLDDPNEAGANGLIYIAGKN